MSIVKRPFYVIGHNRNTLEEVDVSLADGCNAIECDIQINASGTDLCVNHDRPAFDTPNPALPNLPVANPLVPYLQGLRQRLAGHNLAFLLFDVKIGDRPEFAAKLLSAIRTHLTHGTHLPILITVAKFAQRSFFDSILGDLGPREGIGIDEENLPLMVSSHFQKKGVVNQAYGNGIMPLAPGPNVRPSMEEAVYLKAAKGQIKFVYSWTFEAKSSMREQLFIGVDGMIVDDVGAMLEVLKEEPFAGTVRLGTREDNPFVPTVPGYGLAIRTDARDGAGTDANLTFTLQGDRGTVFKTLSAKPTRRFESGYINFVTLHCVDVGTPQHLTVSHDNDGNGPDWFLDDIQVETRTSNQVRSATYDRWITAADGKVTRPLASVELYDLTVVTGDVGGAGTDARITFSLTGDKGTVSKTVDAGPVGWFERNDTDDVSLTGDDIGALQSLTLSHDNAGNGPRWFVDRVTVTRRRTGEAKTFIFRQWIESSQKVSRTPAEVTYLLTVLTGDVGGAGTDANITFTLQGTKGSVSRTIDAEPSGLFEQGDKNTVHLFGQDIGEMVKMTVSHDNQGNGPGWFLERITAERQSSNQSKTFHFHREIDSNQPAVSNG